MQCSIHSCESNEWLNRDVVTSFEMNIMTSRNETISCHYDRWFKEEGAVLHPLKPRPRDVYMTLAPALSLLLSLNVCVCFCKWCRTREHLVTSSKKHDVMKQRKSPSNDLNQLSKSDCDEPFIPITTV